jgi:hypothetical protein
VATAYKQPSEFVTRLLWWLLTLAACALAALLAYCAWGIVQEGKLAEESATWPSVPGTILSASVRNSSGYRGSRTHSVSIHYRFTVDGRELEGGRATFGVALSLRRCQEIVDAHPAGSTAQIHYRPGAPEMNVVEAGGDTAYGLAAVAGLADLIVIPCACFMLWFGVKLLLPPPSRGESRRHEKARARKRRRARSRSA